MDFYLILQDIMNEQDLSIPEIARKSNLSDGTVRSIIKRKQKNVALEVAFKLSEGLNVSLERLNGLPEKTTTENKQKEKYQKEFEELYKKYRSLDPYGKETISYILDRELKRVEQINKQKNTSPVVIEVFPTRHYLQSASAGYGDFNDDSSYETIDLVKQPPVGTSFIVTVDGNSMEPTYKNGDLLFVKAQETVNIGQNGLFTKAGNIYIKEFGENCLLSHNKNGNYPIIYPEIDAPIITQGKIIGICTEDYLPHW